MVKISPKEGTPIYEKSPFKNRKMSKRLVFVYKALNERCFWSAVQSRQWLFLCTGLVFIINSVSAGVEYRINAEC